MHDYCTKYSILNTDTFSPYFSTAYIVSLTSLSSVLQTYYLSLQYFLHSISHFSASNIVSLISALPTWYLSLQYFQDSISFFSTSNIVSLMKAYISFYTIMSLSTHISKLVSRLQYFIPVLLY